ncbi:hypothetical protein [Sedimentitalea sp.]
MRRYRRLNYAGCNDALAEMRGVCVLPVSHLDGLSGDASETLKQAKAT